jgi:hypothetical protein
METIKSRPGGVSVCLRFPGGVDNRGGYFFHFRQGTKMNTFELFDFEKKLIKILNGEDLVKFINHCSGKKFDNDSFLLCQNEINFRSDD